MLFIGLGLPAMAQVNELQGKWSVDFATTLQNMGSLERARYESIPERAKANMRSTFHGRTFNFGADGQLTVQFATAKGHETVNGNWSLIGDINKLTVTAPGTNSEYTVRWIDANRISLIYTNAPAQGLLKSLYLNRIN